MLETLEMHPDFFTVTLLFLETVSDHFLYLHLVCPFYGQAVKIVLRHLTQPIMEFSASEQNLIVLCHQHIMRKSRIHGRHWLRRLRKLY